MNRPALGRERRIGSGPWFGSRPVLTMAVAAALFAAVLSLRFAVADPADAVSLLFSLPIALLAVAFGLRGGLSAGVVGVVLVAVWAGAREVDLSVLGWASRTVPTLLLGVLLGDAVDRLRRSEQERLRLEAVAQRHRDAVEFQDSVVQGLSAAKWALEAGRTERGTEIVGQTLDDAQQLVSQLLRDADMGLDGHRGGGRGRSGGGGARGSRSRSGGGGARGSRRRAAGPSK